MLIGLFTASYFRLCIILKPVVLRPICIWLKWDYLLCFVILHQLNLMWGMAILLALLLEEQPISSGSKQYG
jgi:hypothetical protein